MNALFGELNSHQNVDVIIDIDNYNGNVIDILEKNPSILMKTNDEENNFQVTKRTSTYLSKCREIIIPENLRNSVKEIHLYMSGYIKASSDYGISSYLGNLLTGTKYSNFLGFMTNFVKKADNLIIYSDRTDINNEITSLYSQYNKVELMKSVTTHDVKNVDDIENNNLNDFVN